ncbi:MAG TPA: MFS transporter [Streptosporangiaceae bacterium]|jgi:MFS family permease|nr:MFS transporter [Streptosporangiaceae bacterium]
MNMPNAPHGTIRAALGYTAFRRLLGGLATSQIGDWLYNLALVTLVYSRTHSALWAGVTTAARVVPIVALGPLGGAIADRFDRRRLMIACDAIRLGLMLLLALMAVAHLPILLAPVIAAVATAAGSPYMPCASAVTPRLVPDDDLPGANTARSAVGAIGIIAGPALGGVLLLLGSPALAFVVNAATFGLSALAVLAIPAGPAFAVDPAAAARPSSLRRDVADGAAVLRAHPEALRLVGADIMCSLVYGMQTVLLLLVARHAGLGLHGYGYLFAGIGVGALAGTSVAGRLMRLPHQRAVLLAALAAVGLPMLILPLVSWAVLAVGLAASTGAGAILVEILTETSLQRSLPADVFGRAYGLALPASVAGIVLGSLLAPVLVTLAGGTSAMIISGAVVVGYGLVLLRAGIRTQGELAVAGA